MTAGRAVQRRRAEAAVRSWLADCGLDWEPGARPGEYVVQLPGERKLRTTTSLLVGDHSLSVSAFVVRRPDENVPRVHRWLLERNARLQGIAFALDALGDVYLVGRLPLEGVTEETVDGLLGSVLATADGAFNELLAMGFLTAMRKEWAWRVSRGEPTVNLEAFRHLLAPDDAPDDGMDDASGDGRDDAPDDGTGPDGGRQEGRGPRQ